jgi:tRNA pseudouridine65 synthase
MTDTKEMDYFFIFLIMTNSNPIKLLYQDEHIFAVQKPSGFHVHPHEQVQHRVSRDKIVLYHVRRMMRRHVFPVHRLDAGTSGVLVFALSSEAASKMCQLFANRETQKTYHAVVRGYVQEQGSIEIPLESDSSGELLDAKTTFRCLKTIELPYPVGKKFPTARYSLVEAQPHSGRFHQIRRHFNRISHPLIGDAVHGDSHHNRFFRTHLEIEGLCLKALRLEFFHPWNQKKISITAETCPKWSRIESLFSSSVPMIDLSQL